MARHLFQKHVNRHSKYAYDTHFVTVEKCTQILERQWTPIREAYNLLHEYNLLEYGLDDVHQSLKNSKGANSQGDNAPPSGKNIPKDKPPYKGTTSVPSTTQPQAQDDRPKPCTGCGKDIQVDGMPARLRHTQTSTRIKNSNLSKVIKGKNTKKFIT